MKRQAIQAIKALYGNLSEACEEDFIQATHLTELEK